MLPYFLLFIWIRKKFAGVWQASAEYRQSQSLTAHERESRRTVLTFDEVIKVRKLLRFPDLETVAGIKNWVALKRAIDTQGFPPGFYISPNRRVWFEDVVQAWVEARAAATVGNQLPLKGRAKRVVEEKAAREAAANTAEA